jgi:hypothetical protein
MRTRLCTALALLLLFFGGHERAAGDELKVVTLSCDGMFTPTYGDNKPVDPQPLQKASVVADLNEQTVFFLGYVAPIEGVEVANIRFGGRQIVDYGFIVEMSGNIDRANGHMDATLVMSDPTQPRDPVTATIKYDMVCKVNE